MKKLNLMLLCVLGTLVMTVTSCKKHYSGYCKYDMITTYTSDNYYVQTRKIENYYVDIERDYKDRVVGYYNDLIKGQEHSKSTITPYIITGEGCNFHKGKK